MDASQLKEWIAIFMMDLVPDGQGGYAEAIPAGLTYNLPAKVETIAPERVVSAEQVADRVRYKITIRWEPGLTTMQRVYWREMFLDIDSVTNVDTADTWNELICLRKELGTQ